MGLISSPQTFIYYRFSIDTHSHKHERAHGTQTCTKHIQSQSSPATSNIHILFFPSQRRRRVTVDLTPELYALVN